MARASFKSFVLVLVTVLLAFLLLVSLKSAHPQSVPGVELAISLFQLVVAATAAWVALRLGAEPLVEAPLYIVLGWALTAAASAELTSLISHFALGLDPVRAGGFIGFLFSFPQLVFLMTSFLAVMLTMGELTVGSPLVVGWAVSLTLFVACYVFVSPDVARAHLASRAHVMQYVTFAVQCSIAGFGILPVLFACGLRFRIISLGLVAMAVAAFLFQASGIYRELVHVSAAFDLVWTVGEVIVVFGLMLAREEAVAAEDPRPGEPVLTGMKQLV